MNQARQLEDLAIDIARKCRSRGRRLAAFIIREMYDAALKKGIKLHEREVGSYGYTSSPECVILRERILSVIENDVRIRIMLNSMRRDYDKLTRVIPKKRKKKNG